MQKGETDSETQMGEVRTERILSRPRWRDRQGRGRGTMVQWVRRWLKCSRPALPRGQRREEERRETRERNELDSLHSPLPPEPWRCVIYREGRGYCATEET